MPLKHGLAILSLNDVGLIHMLISFPVRYRVSLQFPVVDRNRYASIPMELTPSESYMDIKSERGNPSAIHLT